jgi:hypothetical protein
MILFIDLLLRKKASAGGAGAGEAGGAGAGVGSWGRRKV